MRARQRNALPRVHGVAVTPYPQAFQASCKPRAFAATKGASHTKQPAHMLPLKQSGRIQEILNPAPSIVEGTPTSFGSVVETGGYSNTVADGPSAIVITYANATGAAVNLGIGANTQIAAASSLTITNPATVAGSTWAAFEQMLTSRELLVAGLNINATSGPTQFSNPFKYWVIDGGGGGNFKNIPLFAYQRNTQQDPNLMTTRFDKPYLLKWNRGFVWTVANGQTVQIALLLQATTNN